MGRLFGTFFACFAMRSQRYTTFGIYTSKNAQLFLFIAIFMGFRCVDLCLRR